MATSANPLILTCRGASRPARAAELVAAELEAAGIGARALEARPGVPLISVDGCAGACCSRRLESLGRRPVATVDAAALPSARAAVTTVRLQLQRHRPRRHRTRPHPPPPASGGPRTHGVRDYLLALDALSAPLVECGIVAPGLPAVAAHVSRLLGVSRPTAGEMLGRLEALGLIARTDTRQVVLTNAGRAAADDAVRRHRLLETFAVQFLDYELADAFDRARSLDSAFDDDSLQRLASALDAPTRCPHGWPIDPAQARIEAAHLRALSTLAAGETATIVCVAERSPELLRELVADRIVPGSVVDSALRDRLSPAAQAGAFML
jgi:DtxR family Mn-dependent transcriptional regulator